MIQTKDKILIKCHPSNVTWDDYVEDCNLAVNTVDINSDEYSTEEEELARKERSDEKRPEISIVQIQLSRFVINHGDLLGYVIMYVKLLKNKTYIYIYFFFFHFIAIQYSEFGYMNTRYIEYESYK